MHIVVSPCACCVSEMNGQADVEVDYKRKYKNLKRKLKFLVYVSTVTFKVWAVSLEPSRFGILQIQILCLLSQEQECFQEELRRAQRKLLKVSRDKRWDYIVCTWKYLEVKQCYVRAVNNNFIPLLSSFLLDRLLQYERVDEDSSGSYYTSSQRLS